jgi:dihydropteroate synthase
MTAWHVRGRTISLERPVVMGILNVTPDSFSDGGQFFGHDAAMARARTMIAEGADIVDVGGESTRPQNATAVSVGEEIHRVVPVIAALAVEFPQVILSVDTVKSEVADAALGAGAHIVNDVSAMRLDAAMATVCAAHGAGVVLMHSRGGVEDMATYEHAIYDGDPADVVIGELRARVAEVIARGVHPSRIVVDPGLGFSKHSEHSLRMLGMLGRFVGLGFPVMIGASRKRFIGELTHTTTPGDRVVGSVAAAVSAFDRGARIFRVHDVGATRQALDVAAAIAASGPA